MNKKEIMAFFDRLAPQWDAHMVTDDRKMKFILDAAGIEPHKVVLDVACGTGVMFPYYLARNVSRVIGVDISSQMTGIAAARYRDPRIEVICGDAETVPVHMLCDCGVIYNAFPHFEDPERLIERLTCWLRPEGRLTVAHGMGLADLQRHHAGAAASVSRSMLTTEQLSAIMGQWFRVDTRISDEEKYVVSGTLLPENNHN